MSGPEHVTSVKMQRAYMEHRPECTCGWVGSYWLRSDQADAEAAQHTACPCVGAGQCLVDDEYPCIFCLTNPCPVVTDAEA